MTERVVVGLDGEMSGVRPWQHKLIQIGACLAPGECFASDIGWDEFEYEPEALAAIGVTTDRVRAGPPATEVDDALHAWLVERGVGPRGLVAVGWRVSTFDIPFVLRTLPRVTGLLSHHTVELNAVCYTLAGTVSYQGGPRDAATWKALANRAAQAYLGALTGAPPAWHDAGFDASAAMAAWLWLRTVVAGHPVPAEDFRP